MPFQSRNLLKKVEQTILSWNMLTQGDKVLAGVSGGPDSVALLHILTALAPAFKLQIGVAHLNHCLRGTGSDQDAAFVADLASKLDVPCYIDAIDVRNDSSVRKLSLETAARSIRYGFFDRIRQRYNYDKIATGHHQNDNAELVLMFFLRGSGTSGISGIPPVREGRIIRPLIDVNRNELVAFLDENGLSYQIDDSNRDLRFFRNRIRHETIPYLQTHGNPGIVETLNRFSRIARSENEWMDEIIGPIYNHAVVHEGQHRQELSIPAFSAYPEAVRRRLIRTAIARTKGDLQRISFSHIESARLLAEHQQESGLLMLPDGVRVQREKDFLIFLQTDASRLSRKQMIHVEQPEFTYAVANTEQTVIIEEIGAMMIFSLQPICTDSMNDSSNHIALLDLGRLHFPLKVRNIQPGDRFIPLGTSGSQKVQKYFIDHKIARSQRPKIPVLLSGNQIVWLAGHRIDDRFKITPSTRSVLKIEFLKSVPPILV